MLTTKVAFGRLHRNVPQKKLDLLQLASRSVAEPSTGPSQIVWRQLRHANALGGSFTMCQTAFTVMPSPHVLLTLLTRRKSFPRSIPAAASQSSSSVLTQSGTGTVRTWPPLAHQINNGPMLF